MMRMRPAAVTAILAATALSACAPGDMRLGASDVAARANGSWLVESVQHPVGYHQTRDFTLPCLDGTMASQASAMVTNVGGTWNRPQDYSVNTRVTPNGHGVTAQVTHIGAEHPRDVPVVVVELRAFCRAPVKG